MKIKVIKYFLFVLLLVVSCEGELNNLSLGGEIMKPTSRLVLVDTFKVDVSTVILDSIPTSGKNIVLAGTFDDINLGRIVAKSYFQVGYPRYTFKEEEFYDSVALVLTYEGYTYGDTTVRQYLTIRKLTERLELNEQNYFYNTTSKKYDPDPVGEILFYPRPSTEEKFTIRLDDTFGQEIYNYLQEARDDEFKINEFGNFLKGLVIVPDEMYGNSINGYTVNDTSLAIKIYTHTVGAEENKFEITLPVKNPSLQYNQITCDWSHNEAFNNHQQRNAIPSAVTGDMSFINAGLGIFTKFSFPTLTSLVEFQNMVLVRAKLFIKPAYGATVDLPPAVNFTIYRTGKKNSLDSPLLLPNSEPIRPVLNIDELYNERTWYVFDISDHLAYDLSDHYIDPWKALSVTFSSSVAASTLDQLLVGGNGNKLTEPKLELLFLFYDLE